MPTITTKDGTQIYYKDWGTGQPIVFSHGWTLTADDWDGQMLFFGQRGYRVIAHDRRGHGRSDQTGTATIWTLTRTISRRSSKPSISTTPSWSAIPPEAAKSPAISAATVPGVLPKRR